MKPTHGLVPYTSIMPIEITVDHTGPMTHNVYDNALLEEPTIYRAAYAFEQSGDWTRLS